jgi:glucokinase-like ROK family protein
MAISADFGERGTEPFAPLGEVLDLIRCERAHTRPRIGELSGLGRAVVAQRVGQLIALGLVEDGPAAASTGGRPARSLRFRAEAGVVLSAELGATSVTAGIADLSGRFSVTRKEPISIADGPEPVLRRTEQLLADMLAARQADAPPVWGVGIGLPGPVEFATGRPIAPPIMPGWDGYPVRQRLSSRFGVPCWVDNEVNLMALGELRDGQAQTEQDVIFLKIGTGIGAGLVSRGQLHHGAQGAAGDVGHVQVVDDPGVVCRCGKLGCLEAIAGGGALGKMATAAAHDGRSPWLASRVGSRTALTSVDLAEAAEHGDPFAVALFEQSGRYIGRMLAALVNFYNPSLIIIGGGVSSVGDVLLASVRETIYSRSLPLATRDLRITRSLRAEVIGAEGAARMVIDELFSAARLPLWIQNGSPVGMPHLADVA